MTDTTGAPAPEASSAPAEAPQASTPTIVDSQPRPPEPTPRDAIERAFSKIEAEGQEAESAEAPPEPKAPRDDGRDEKGRFVSKAADGTPEAAAESAPAEATPAADKAPLNEPPKRFSKDAQAAWKDAPEAVRAEVHRAVREMETGLQQYQRILEPIRPYFELAQKHGTTVDRAMAQYVELENLLRSNPMVGMQSVLADIGMTPEQYAAKVLGRTPDQARQTADTTIQRLEGHIGNLERQIQALQGGMQKTEEQRVWDASAAQVEAFTSQPGKDRMLRDEDFANMVARLIKGGIAADLATAHDMVERLMPSPPAPASSAAPPPAPPPQPRGANLSITGAPASGSNPTPRGKPSATNREALDKSFAALGLG